MRAKKRRKLDYGALASCRFPRSLPSVAMLVRSCRFLRVLPFLPLLLPSCCSFPSFPSCRSFPSCSSCPSFLHAIIEFPSLSFASTNFATFCRCFVFLSFPRCTIIEFPELKAPPPPMHYVTLWSLLTFGQIAFLKRQVVIWLSHTTVA